MRIRNPSAYSSQGSGKEKKERMPDDSAGTRNMGERTWQQLVGIGRIGSYLEPDISPKPQTLIFHL